MTTTPYQLSPTDGRWNMMTLVDKNPCRDNAILYISGEPVDENWKKAAKVMVMSAQGGTAVELASNAYLNRANGAMQTWRGPAVIYHGRDGGFPKRMIEVTLDCQVIDYEGGPTLRSIHPNGAYGIYTPLAEGGGVTGINAMHLCEPTRGETHQILSAHDVLMASQHSQVERTTMPVMMNVVFSPDGKHIMWSLYENREIMVCDSDGSHIRSLTHGGHRCWLPDSSGFVYVSYPFSPQNPRHLRLCLLTGEDRYLSKPGPGGGYPSVSPDGKWVVNDEMGWMGLYLTEIETGQVQRLCDVGTTYGSGKPEGTQINPVWSPDSSQVLFNSDESGTCQIYVVEVPQ